MTVFKMFATTVATRLIAATISLFLLAEHFGAAATRLRPLLAAQRTAVTFIAPICQFKK